MRQIPNVLDAPTRNLLLNLLQERNSAVSQEAANLTPNVQEPNIINTLLRRKSADLRRSLICLLAKDPTVGTNSALDLLKTSNTEQRQAGLQLLLELAAQPPADFTPKNVTEQSLYAKLTAPDTQLSLSNGLGLFNPADLTKPQPLQVRGRDYPLRQQQWRTQKSRAVCQGRVRRTARGRFANPHQGKTQPGRRARSWPIGAE